MRFVGLDLHKRTLEVCILDATGRVLARHSVVCERRTLEAFARAHLGPADKLAVEATTSTWAVAAILRPFVAAIVVGNPMQTRAIAQAKVKTDKVDAEILAQLLAADYLPAVWRPDPATAALRRQVLRRAHIVRQRTRWKNQVHAILHRNLIPRCPAADLFGHKGPPLAGRAGPSRRRAGRGAKDAQGVRAGSAVARDLARASLGRAARADAPSQPALALPGSRPGDARRAQARRRREGGAEARPRADARRRVRRPHGRSRAG